MVLRSPASLDCNTVLSAYGVEQYSGFGDAIPDTMCQVCTYWYRMIVLYCDAVAAHVDLRDHSRTPSPERMHSPIKYVAILRDGELIPPVVLLLAGGGPSGSTRQRYKGTKFIPSAIESNSSRVSATVSDIILTVST